MKTEETIAAPAPTSGSAAPKKARAKKVAAKPAAKKAAKSPKKRAASKKPVRPASGEVRADTKKSTVLALLRRKQGATTAEIAKVTDWQNHSIRGFISGHVTKKMGLKVESTRSGAGERTYRIAK